ncbi:hypothetical protein V5799_006875 [Amblyomma americanum]|uniref:Uncharacterized protein n=1 Tax=Amblyomma americanum TaxID=6943 RepID=A0AAQ4DV57_AMBAM
MKVTFCVMCCVKKKEKSEFKSEREIMRGKWQYFMFVCEVFEIKYALFDNIVLYEVFSFVIARRIRT